VWTCRGACAPAGSGVPPSESCTVTYMRPSAGAPALECVAVHEAAHATARLVQGWRFADISVVSTVATFGHCSFQLVQPCGRVEFASGAGQIVRDGIVAVLAGSVADHLHCGRHPDEAAYQAYADLGRAQMLAELVIDLDPTTVIDLALAETRAMLSVPDVTARLGALVRALMARHRLSYTDACDIWRRLPLRSG
jgi:hypothetical protein